jgi:hypothetical protein
VSENEWRWAAGRKLSLFFCLLFPLLCLYLYVWEGKGNFAVLYLAAMKEGRRREEEEEEEEGRRRRRKKKKEEEEEGRAKSVRGLVKENSCCSIYKLSVFCFFFLLLLLFLSNGQLGERLVVMSVAPNPPA